ncbi:hypothetical protein B0T19DRAFT_492947 [Cercophora scortea]|uniref:HECT-type E3 ubiquitin transferase n=1 Tax=Cercophora scortea TaxID=314031 RepID=A0AAE0IA68_9PEZI|nr:hypothetical protein B0T19DRAFT_492947 [Cercophora scortea]
MAPWPDRSQDQNQNQNQNRSPSQNEPSDRRRPHAASTGSPRPAGASFGSRFRSASRVPDLPVLDSLHIQPDSTSSSSSDLHPSELSRPRHTRSMSHPFPSLFSIKKKKSIMMVAGGSGEDSADEPGPLPNLKQPQTRGHRNGSSNGSSDYSTGNCMTCGSLVRWPRELHVFKCTICLTINDLKPIGRDPRLDGNQHKPPQTPGSDERSSPGADGQISLEHTRSLAAQCIRSFLQSSLRQRMRRGSTDHEGPSMTPSPPSPNCNRAATASPRAPVAARPTPTEGTEKWPQFNGQAGLSPPRNPSHYANNTPRSYSTSHSDGRPVLQELDHQSPQPSSVEPEARRMFKLLEDYIVSCFTSFPCLNSSFTAGHSNHQSRSSGEAARRRNPEPRRGPQNKECPIMDLDAKLLLLGDFAENGSWWTGGQEDAIPGSRSAPDRCDNGPFGGSMRNPRIDWAEMDNWYMTVVDVARSWTDIYEQVVNDDLGVGVPFTALQEIEAQILVGQDHVQKTLLKACESILKRPGRPLTAPYELRFIVIVAANPLLYNSYKPYAGEFGHPEPGVRQSSSGSRGSGPASGRHSVIIKRIAGLMSNAPVECHNHLVAWFARYPESSFVQIKDMIAGFLAYRLMRQNEKKYEIKVDVTDGLIPNMGADRSAASLHAALGQTPRSGKKQKGREKRIVYQDDWQIKAAARVLSFLFAANNTGHVRRSIAGRSGAPGHSTKRPGLLRGQILATTDFYSTLLDDSDLVADFEAWERKQGKFSFCQFPFLLSIGAKIQILEYDAKRQMENKARDAFFSSIMTHRVVEQFLTLHIRRDCLVDDSLKAVGEVIGSGGEDIKKGLKIIFKGEEGVDAGGLRKEWFLLLVREVFNPDHGMFTYDEDSRYCYFNPNSWEPTEQFFLVGVVFGLAIYNSTILDVALPPFAFRKLLLAAPPPAVSTSQPRQAMTYSLDDLAEYRPRLAHGLRQLLDFDGDVEQTFCLDFVIDTDRYGYTERVPLCPGGERRPVTNLNRKEYVDLYVRYLLDTAVTRQFEPFKRGFFTVCGGNALSLFRPEEIELLVRGSDEPLDIGSLKMAAEYDNWGVPNPVESQPIIWWFWDTFESASPQDQRKLLLFITGSDRIPAMGAASLSIRISCLGDDCGRYPTARTCFNVLTLWRYPTRERLEELLWTAVYESEGFGLK